MSSISKVAGVLVLGALSSVLADDHAGHNHHVKEPCGCASTEDGWTIDCTNMTTIQAAYDELVADKCGASEAACDADTHCQSAYRVVQAHHDHCPPSTLPTEMEQAFHTYETACAEHGCLVGRQFAKGAAKCPAVECEDNKVNMTAAVTAMAGCDTDCSSAACIAAFQQVHSFHDSCHAEDLTDGIETGLHKYEDACADKAACNTVDTAFDANECDEDHTVTGGDQHTAKKADDGHEGHDHGDHHDEDGDGDDPDKVTAAQKEAAANCAKEICPTQITDCLTDTACAATIKAETAPPAGTSLATCTKTAAYLKCVAPAGIGASSAVIVAGHAVAAATAMWLF